MRITLSFATTADGFLDDTSPRRLVISTPEDWAAVHRLRAEHDAILVGAETLRRDNPSLRLRDEAAREARRRAGRRPDPAKVTLTRSGAVDPALRFFTQGDADRYLFSPQPLPLLDGVCSVICTGGEPVTAARIVTELEKRGIESLFVEGGARVLGMFLAEGMADTVRQAVNPALRVGSCGYAPFAFTPPAGAACRREQLGGMEVNLWRLRPDTSEADRLLLREAIAQSRLSPPCATAYRVGAVVVTAAGERFAGYTHETSATHHAEQEAILKAQAAGADLRGAAIYTSMEPCSQRASEPESCTQLILRHGFARVVFALYEPDCFVQCRGALTLREAGLDVRCCPELGPEVRAINGHIGG